MTDVVLNSEQKREFNEHGVVRLPGVFARWVEHLRDAVELALLQPGPDAEDYVPPGEPGCFFEDTYLWRRHDAFRSFAFDSPAASIAAQLMGSSTAALFYDQVFVKEPGTRVDTPWHQDHPYWELSGSQTCSLWIPLDVVSADTCIEFVRGSQRWGPYRPRYFDGRGAYGGRENLRDLPEISAMRADNEIARWDLEPGDCIAFHSLTVHGAPGNASHHRRRAVATRWIGDDVRYSTIAGESAFPKGVGPYVDGQPLPESEVPLVWCADVEHAD